MSDSTSSGVGVLGMLGVLFVGLKLGGVISWSWWWVTAPFWGGLAAFMVVFIGTLLILWLAVVTAWLFERFVK